MNPTPCTACDTGAPVHARGWCRGCYVRWLRAGRPDDGPPRRLDHAEHITRLTAGHSAARRARIEDFGFLRADGLSIAAAAARVGVTERTGWDYEMHLRRQETAA